MKIRIITGVFAALCLSAAAPGDARAGTWAKEWTLKTTNSILRGSRDAQRQTRDGVNDLRQEVRESTNRLIAALRSHSGEQSSYQDKQIEARRRIEDAAQQNASQRLREEFRARAESGEFDPPPDICLLAGLFSGKGGGQPPNLGSDTAEAARLKSSGSDPAVRAGGGALNSSIVQARKDLAGGLGRQDPSTDVSALFEEPTIKIGNAKDKEALERLMRNLTDPFPPRPVTASELLTPEGVARAANRTIQEARANSARETLAMVTNMRAEVGPSDPYKPYVEDISGYNHALGDKISELQQIDIRTLRHYAPTEEKVTERSSLTQKQLLGNLVDQMSIGNRIAYLQLELDTRRAAVDTQILSILNNDR